MTSPLSVVMISPSGVLGGAEAVFADLARAAPRHGLDLTLVTLQEGPLAGALSEIGYSVEAIRAGRLRQPLAVLAAGRALRRVIARSQADVVVSNMPKAHIYAALPAWTADVPAVWWQTGIPSPPHWIDRTATALPAAMILANSAAAAAAQRRIPGTSQVRVLYPGTDTDRYHPRVAPTLRRQLAVEPGEIVIGLVGRLQPWKGQEAFLRAASVVLEHEPQCRFAVIGGALLGWEGDYPERLRALAGELGITENVVFTGHSDDMPGVFTSLDIVVNASNPEPFGLVITEAMAAGRPVAALATGGPLEIVEHGVTGLLCDPGSVGALTAGILELIALGEGERAAMGARGRERVIAKFSLDSMARGFAEALRDVVESRRTSDR